MANGNYSTKVWNSKKFKAAIMAAVSAGIAEFMVVFGKEMGIDIPQEFVLMILAPFLAYITGKSAADIAYNVKNGKKTEITSVSPGAPSTSPCISADYKAPPNNLDIGDTSIARRNFETMQRADFTLTNLDDPKQVERDYLAKWEAQLEAAKNLWRATRQTEPPDNITDSCFSGDWSYEARALLHSTRDLQIQKDFIAAIKNNKALSYQLGGLGYRLNGVPWQNIPLWAQQNILEHTPEGRGFFAQEFQIL